MENSMNLQDQMAPVYNIKAIAKAVGLLPVTLRAWERRYGLPEPQRGQQGYRLYSEHDLLTLRWLKQQIDTGMSISRAVELLMIYAPQAMTPQPNSCRIGLSKHHPSNF